MACVDTSPACACCPLQPGAGLQSNCPSTLQVINGGLAEIARRGNQLLFVMDNKAGQLWYAMSCCMPAACRVQSSSFLCVCLTLLQGCRHSRDVPVPLLGVPATARCQCARPRGVSPPLDLQYPDPCFCYQSSLSMQGVTDRCPLHHKYMYNQMVEEARYTPIPPRCCVSSHSPVSSSHPHSPWYRMIWRPTGASRGAHWRINQPARCKFGIFVKYVFFC